MKEHLFIAAGAVALGLSVSAGTAELAAALHQGAANEPFFM